MMSEPNIPFNRPTHVGSEAARVLEALRSTHLSGNGPFSKTCEAALERLTGCRRALMVPSCTHALEMAALLIDIRPGDEVIMPSFTFVSTANAFVLRGATIVFVDIRPDTLNMDETLVEAAVTSRTRAVVPVHYAGVACEMDAIMEIAARHKLWVIEDAAQALGARYRARPLGSIGHLAALSFHETKNLTSGGEGGALLVNDPGLIARSEIIREKGTNRSQFFRGQVDKYTWVDLGSSYLPSEVQCACLSAQLEAFDVIAADRRATWNHYRRALRDCSGITLPAPPSPCDHNAHLFHVRVAGIDARTRLIDHLARLGVHAVFHYVPLHTAPAGMRFGRFHGTDLYTTRESSRLVRLPLWHGLSHDQVSRIAQAVREAMTAEAACAIQ